MKSDCFAALSFSQRPLVTAIALMLTTLTIGAASAQQTPPASEPAPAADGKKPDVKPTEAKPDGKSKDGAQKTEKIEVTGKNTYDPRRDDTATKIVITQEEIQKFGDTQLSDVFKRLPGVTPGGGRGGPGPRMRGLGGGYTQILLNGEPAPRGFSIDQLTPSLIERIEIVRAATAEFSTQAVAGTINIVLKEKISFKQREFRFGGSANSVGQSVQTGGQISDSIDKFSYQIGGFYSHNYNDVPGTGRTYSVDNNRVVYDRESQSKSKNTNDTIGISPRLVWSLGQGNSVTWQIFANGGKNRNSSESSAYSVTGAQPPYARSLSPGGKTDYYFARSDINWLQRFENGSRIDLKFGFNGFGNKGNYAGEGFNTAGVKTLETVSKSKADETGINLTGKYSRPFGESHSFVTGWDVSRNDRDEGAGTEYRIYVNPDAPIRPPNTDDKTNTKIDKLAFFVQDEWNVNKNWSIYGGIRWEQIKTNTSGNTFESSSNTSRVTSPILQTLYKIPDLKGNQLRFALTRTYKAPPTNSLAARRSFSSNNSATSPDNFGNPSLKPELANGVDLSYDIFFEKGGSVSLSYAKRRITDFTRRDTFFEQRSNRWVSTTVNGGRADVNSLEFDTKLPIQSFFPEAPNIETRFNFSRNTSKVNSVPGPNNRLDAQTPMSATAGFDYKTKDGKFSTGASYSWRNAGLVRIDADQLSFATVTRDIDLYALYRFTPKANVRVSLNNILGQDSYTNTTILTPSGFVQSESRNKGHASVRVGFEFKF